MANDVWRYNYDFGLGLSTNIVQHHSFIVKFGYNEDIDAGVEETVWSTGGVWTPSAAAQTVSVVSTSAADASAGTGAQYLLITGIGSDRKTLTEYVFTNGLTPVITNGTFYEINRVAVALSGSQDENVGTLTFTQTSSGKVLATVPAGESITQKAVYTVPLEYDAYLNSLFLNAAKPSGGGAPTVEFELYSYNYLSDTHYNIATVFQDTATGNTVSYDQKYANITSGGNTLYINANTDTNNTRVYARFLMQLKANGV